MSGDDALAAAALARYDLGRQATLRLINVSENATFRVDTPEGPSFALRLHREGYHSRTAIASELDWVVALRRGSEVITPVPVPGRDGALIQTIPPGRHAVLFQWETGIEPPETDLLPGFERLGEVTALMHRQSRSYWRPPWFTRLTWDFAGAFGDAPHWGRWQDGLGIDAAAHALFARTLRRIEARLERFGKGPERFGLVHCDMRLANLLVEDEVTKVIDFDDCGFSWYLYDCATALSFMEHRAGVPELVAAWVRGYRKAAALSPEDEAEIPTFIMFRRLLLIAWNGSHADTALARSMGAAYTQATPVLCEAFLR